MRFQKSQDWLHFLESSEFNAKQRVSTTGVRLFLSATGVRLFPQLSSALVALLRRLSLPVMLMIGYVEFNVPENKCRIQCV